MSYYEVQIQFEVEGDNGKIKKVKENWLVDALSVTEAEARAIQRIGTPEFEFEVRAVKPSRIVGIVESTDIADDVDA